MSIRTSVATGRGAPASLMSLLMATHIPSRLHGNTMALSSRAGLSGSQSLSSPLDQWAEEEDMSSILDVDYVPREAGEKVLTAPGGESGRGADGEDDEGRLKAKRHELIQEIAMLGGMVGFSVVQGMVRLMCSFFLLTAPLLRQQVPFYQIKLLFGLATQTEPVIPGLTSTAATTALAPKSAPTVREQFLQLKFDHQGLHVMLRPLNIRVGVTIVVSHSVHGEVTLRHNAAGDLFFPLVDAKGREQMLTCKTSIEKNGLMVVNLSGATYPCKLNWANDGITKDGEQYVIREAKGRVIEVQSTQSSEKRYAFYLNEAAEVWVGFTPSSSLARYVEYCAVHADESVAKASNLVNLPGGKLPLFGSGDALYADVCGYIVPVTRNGTSYVLQAKSPSEETKCITWTGSEWAEDEDASDPVFPPVSVRAVLPRISVRRSRPQLNESYEWLHEVDPAGPTKSRAPAGVSIPLESFIIPCTAVSIWTPGYLSETGALAVVNYTGEKIVVDEGRRKMPSGLSHLAGTTARDYVVFSQRQRPALVEPADSSFWSPETRVNGLPTLPEDVLFIVELYPSRLIIAYGVTLASGEAVKHRPDKRGECYATVDGVRTICNYNPAVDKFELKGKIVPVAYELKQLGHYCILRGQLVKVSSTNERGNLMSAAGGMEIYRETLSQAFHPNIRPNGSIAFTPSAIEYLAQFAVPSARIRNIRAAYPEMRVHTVRTTSKIRCLAAEIYDCLVYVRPTQRHLSTLSTASEEDLDEEMHSLQLYDPETKVTGDNIVWSSKCKRWLLADSLVRTTSCLSADEKPIDQASLLSSH